MYARYRTSSYIILGLIHACDMIHQMCTDFGRPWQDPSQSNSSWRAVLSSAPWWKCESTINAEDGHLKCSGTFKIITVPQMFSIIVVRAAPVSQIGRDAQVMLLLGFLSSREFWYFDISPILLGCFVRCWSDTFQGHVHYGFCILVWSYKCKSNYWSLQKSDDSVQNKTVKLSPVVHVIWGYIF